MCGIFGYYNYRVPHSRREILECLLTGLRRLEYRGYDSAGVCLDTEPVQQPGPDGAAAGGPDGPANGSSADGATHGALRRRCCRQPARSTGPACLRRCCGGGQQRPRCLPALLL